MSTKKSIIARIIAACSRKQIVVSVPIKITSPLPWPDPVIHPLPFFPSDKPKHKPCFYIDTKESPWAVIVWIGGKWTFEATRPKRESARNLRDYWREKGYPAKVVRAMIPTR